MQNTARKQGKRWLAGMLAVGMLAASLPSAALAQAAEDAFLPTVTEGGVADSAEETLGGGPTEGQNPEEGQTAEGQNPEEGQTAEGQNPEEGQTNEGQQPAAPGGQDTPGGEEQQPSAGDSEPAAGGAPETGEGAARVQAMIDALPDPASLADAGEDALENAANALAELDEALAELDETERAALQLGRLDALRQALQAALPAAAAFAAPVAELSTVTYYQNEEVTITKVWNDNGNSEGKRPADTGAGFFADYLGLTYFLQAASPADGDGETPAKKLILSEENTPVEGEPAALTADVLFALSGQNVDTLPTAGVASSSLVDGLYTVRYQYGAAGEASPLPETVKIDDTAYTVFYAVQEKPVAGYITEVAAQDGNALTVTNTLEDDFSATVEWKDNSNAYGTRPDEDTYRDMLILYCEVNGERQEIELTQELKEKYLQVADNGDGSFTITTSGLPAYSPEGLPCTYSLALPTDIKEDGSVKTEEDGKANVSQHYYTESTAENNGNLGGAYDSLLVNQGNHALATDLLYSGGTATYTLTNNISFVANKVWKDGDGEAREGVTATLYIYRVAENNAQSNGGTGSVVTGSNLSVEGNKTYIVDGTGKKLALYVLDASGAYGDGGTTSASVHSYHKLNEDGTPGEEIGAWYDDGTVIGPDGAVLGALDAAGNLLDASSGEKIGELHADHAQEQGAATDPGTLYQGHICLHVGGSEGEDKDIEVVRIVTGTLVDGSPVAGYNQVVIPTGTDNSEDSSEGWQTGKPQDDHCDYLWKVNGEMFTIQVGATLAEDGTLLSELPMYDAQGRRYIYYAVEQISGSGSEEYQSIADNRVIYRPDTLAAAGDTYLLNGGTLTNKLSSPITVTASKTFNAAAMQEMPETQVTMILQSRRKPADEDTDEDADEGWQNVSLAASQVPKDEEGNPLTDANDNQQYLPVEEGGEIAYYNRLITLTDFQAESMTRTESIRMDNYDADGYELEYRWVELAVTMQEGEGAVTQQNEDGYYKQDDIITMQPDNTADNVAPGTDEARTTAQFEVSYGEDGEVINTLVANTQVQLKKTWLDEDGEPITQEWLDDDEHSDVDPSATFILLQNGQPMQIDGKNAKITLNPNQEGGEFSATREHLWSGLPRYDNEGHEYVYTVQEEDNNWLSDVVYTKEVVTGTGVKGEEVQLLQTNAAVVNRPIGDQIVIDVRKEWLDDGDLNCRRPVEVTLYDAATGSPVEAREVSGGRNTLMLTAGGNWEGRFVIPNPDKDKTAADYIALETGLLVTKGREDTGEDGITAQDAQGSQILPVAYGKNDIKQLIKYLKEKYRNTAYENGTEDTRLGWLSSGQIFDALMEAEDSVAVEILQNLVAGHLGYEDEGLNLQAPHYYNVYIGREAEADNYASYVMYNQRTGVVYETVTKTWVDGGDGLPVTMALKRDGQSIETIELNPQAEKAAGTTIESVKQGDETVGWQMTWDSEQADHKDEINYNETTLKPKRGYPKYDWKGRLLNYTVEEIKISGQELDGESRVKIKNPVTGVTDTYVVTTAAGTPVYGADRHSGDEFSYAITNKKQDTYTLTAKKVWQDDGVDAKLNHSNDLARLDVTFNIYRTSAYTAGDLQDKTLDEIKDDIQLVKDNLKWNTQYNQWYWVSELMNEVERYDPNGRPYVYLLVEVMRANGDGIYHTFYYNANLSDFTSGKSEEEALGDIRFAPQAKVTTLQDVGVTAEDGSTVSGTDAYGNTVTVGKEPTTTQQVFAPTQGDEHTSTDFLILSDGQNCTGSGEYNSYWSGTVVNYREADYDLSGKKIWSGLPNTGSIMPDEYLPALTVKLWKSKEAPNAVTKEDLEPVLDKNSEQREKTIGVKGRSNMYAFDFGSLPRYDEYGQAYGSRIYYYVTEEYLEEGVGGYAPEGYLEAEISALPHNDFTLRNVYTGSPAAELTLQKLWPGFDPTTGLYTDALTNVQKELPTTTFFKLESIMPGVAGEDLGDGTKGYHIESYDCYIKLTVSYDSSDGDAGGREYSVTAEIVDANENELKSPKATVKLGAKDGEEEDPPTAQWTVTITGLRTYAPNGQKMIYRLTELGSTPTGSHDGYTVTAQLSGDADCLILGENVVSTSMLTRAAAAVKNFLLKAFQKVQNLLGLNDDEDTGGNAADGAGNTGGNAADSLGTAAYTNSYKSETTSYSFTKSFQYGTDHYNHSEYPKCSITVVLCRQWYSSTEKQWLNEIVLDEDRNPVTKEVEFTPDSADQQTVTFSEEDYSLLKFAPNGTPYQYFVIEDVNEAPNFAPASVVDDLKFQNEVKSTNSEGKPQYYTYSSSRKNTDGSAVQISIQNGKWGVSKDYQVKAGGTVTTSGVLNNAIPRTTIQVKKTWKIALGSQEADLYKALDGKDSTITQAQAEAYIKMLYELDALPHAVTFKVQKWDRNTSEWVSASTDSWGNTDLTNWYTTIGNCVARSDYTSLKKLLNNLEGDVFKWSDSMPRYEPGCNGQDGDGCTGGHKEILYRVVEELTYSQNVVCTFPNESTTVNPEGDKYDEWPGNSNSYDNGLSLVTNLGADTPVGTGVAGTFDATVQIKKEKSIAATATYLTNTLPLRPLRIDKVWDDNTNKDDTRPASLAVTVYRDLTENQLNGTAAPANAQSHTWTLNYSNAADAAQNTWSTWYPVGKDKNPVPIYVPMYSNPTTGDTSTRTLSTYAVIENGAWSTLLKSDGSPTVPTPKVVFDGLNGSKYELTAVVSKNTADTDGMADTLTASDQNRNKNYFIFTNKLTTNDQRRELTATKKWEDQAGWANLTRPAIRYTLEFYDETLKTPEGEEGGEGQGDEEKQEETGWTAADSSNASVKAITGEVTMRLSPQDEDDAEEGYQTVLTPGEDGVYPSVIWNVNSFYPKTAAEPARVPIRYRVVEEMGQLESDGTFTPLTGQAAYTSSGGEYSYKWVKPDGDYNKTSETQTITNTLRTVPLNITKTWQGDEAYPETMRPTKVTYEVQYRLANVTTDPTTGKITVDGWVTGSSWTPAHLNYTPPEEGAETGEGKWDGFVTLSEPAEDTETWSLTDADVLQLPLFDRDGHLFIYRVREVSITYGTGDDAVTHYAVNAADYTIPPTEAGGAAVSVTYEKDTDNNSTGFLELDGIEPPAPTTSKWDGTLGGYTGHVVTVPQMDANGIPKAWYAGGSTDSVNTNTFETTGLTVQKKIASDDYSAQTFPFEVKITQKDGANLLKDGAVYAWTIVCTASGHVDHSHAQHGNAMVESSKLLIANAKYPAEGEKQPENDNAIYLGHGDVLYIHYLPAGVTCTVTELNHDGYQAEYKVDEEDKWTIQSTDKLASVTTNSNEAQNITFLNRKASLAVLKIDGGGSPLPGAEFTLYSSGEEEEDPQVRPSALMKKVAVNLEHLNDGDTYDADTGHVYVASETKEYTVHREGEGTDASHFYYKPLTEEEKAQYNSGTLQGEVVAVAEFQNLPVGEYRLKETGVPDGYLSLTELTGDGRDITLPLAQGEEVYYNVSLQVTNYKGMKLPTTGDGGVHAPVAAGLLLFALGLFLLLCQYQAIPADPAVPTHTRSKKRKGE